MQTKNKKIDLHKLLGLAKRAGKLQIGRSAVVNAIKQDRVKILIIAEDASQKISRELEKSEKDIQVLRFGVKNQLGEILGRDEVAVLAICDSHFSKAFLEAIDGDRILKK